MPTSQLYLKDGVDPKRAAETLRELITGARNIPAAVAGGLPHRALMLRDKYLDWVESAELQLSNLAIQPDTLAMLQTERYWHIREIDESTARPWPLVSAEIESQRVALERMERDLETRVERLSQAPGHITVLDTNMWLEFLPPDQIDWTAAMNQPSVRLVVPLRVIEELDAKKYARRTDLADRARRALSQLEGIVGADGLPGAVRPSVTVEVLVDPGPRRRLADADEEILETCESFRQLTGRGVSLVTTDTAMRLRAGARSIAVARLPEKYERQREPAPPVP